MPTFPDYRRILRLPLVTMLSFILAAFAACGSTVTVTTGSGTTTAATATTTTTRTTIFGVYSNGIDSATGATTYSIRGYDGTTHTQRFVQPISGSPVVLLRGQHHPILVSVKATPDTSGGTSPSSTTYVTSYGDDGSQLHQVSLGNLIPEQSLVTGDTAIVGGTQRNGKVVVSSVQFVALDMTSGVQLWQETVAAGTHIYNFSIADHIFVGNLETPSGPLFTAFDPSNGKILWQTTPAANAGFGGNVIATAKTVFSIMESNLVAQETGAGSVNWKKPFATMLSGGVDNGEVLAADTTAIYTHLIDTAGKDFLAAFAASDGHLLWQIAETDGHQQLGQFATLAAGTLYIKIITADPNNNDLRAVNTAGGATLWSVPTGGIILQPVAVTTNSVYVDITVPLTAAPFGKARLSALSPSNGSTLWQADTTDPDIEAVAAYPA